MEDKIQQSVKEYGDQLKKLGIENKILEHPASKSIDDVVRSLGLTRSDSAATLVMKAGNEFVAIIRRDDGRLDTKKVKNLLGVDNLRIATDEEFIKVTGLTPGAATYYNKNISKTLIDEKILEKEFIVGGSGSFSCSIRHKTSDLVKIPGSEIVDVSDFLSSSKSGLKRILTGDRPTGKMHVGHYVGSLENRVKLQDSYDQFVMIADVQALTDNFDKPEKVRSSIKEVLLDYLAVGIDPTKTTIFIQSLVPEIAELTVFYLNLVTLERVLRNPTVKDEIKQKGFEKSLPAGFAMYPVSQAADITIFNANLVPVGEDQLPMIEQTREIVRKFNSLYGEVFVEPEALVGEVKRLPGIDGNTKMGKSLGNAIYLSDTEDELKKKVMSMYTDPSRIHPTDPGKVEGNPVFVYHDSFNPNKEEVEDLKKRYEEGTVGDVEVKQKLFVALNEFLKPIRERRAEFAKDPENLDKILKEGTEKAREVARETMKQVRKAMKIDYFK